MKRKRWKETNKEKKNKREKGDRGEKLICYRRQEMRARDGKDPFILMKTPCGV